MRVKKATKIILAWELCEQGLGKSSIARRLGAIEKRLSHVVQQAGNHR